MGQLKQKPSKDFEGKNLGQLSIFKALRCKVFQREFYHNGSMFWTSLVMQEGLGAELLPPLLSKIINCVPS
jgi:hypothetical protein